MWRCVALVRTEVSEDIIVYIIRVTGIFGLETTLEATSDRRTPVLTTATRRHIPEDDIFHCHRRENLKSYKSTNQLFSVAKK
jgi:hypothetical protein